MSKHQYKNLTFSGGGMKIYSSVGAIKVLQEQNILGDIQNISGSSAGSMLGLLVSLNMSADEIEDFFLNKFDPMLEAKEKHPKEETVRFFEEYGRYSGEKTDAQLAELLIQKVGNGNITFKQLHDIGCKNLYVAATDLTEKKSTIFSWEDTPNVKVIDAIHASCAYPLFFTPVKLVNNHNFVDGGVLNHYPVNVFESAKFLPDPSLKYNPETLGIFIGKKGQGLASVKFENMEKLFEPFNNMNPELIENYLSSLNPDNFNECNAKEYDIYCYIRDLISLNLESRVPNHGGDEILIDVKMLNSLDLSLPMKDRVNLIEQGKATAEEFFYLENYLHA